MGVRSRLSSVVQHFAIDVLEGLLSRFESDEDGGRSASISGAFDGGVDSGLNEVEAGASFGGDLGDDDEIDADLDALEAELDAEIDALEAEAYLDAVDDIEDDLMRLEMEIDTDLGGSPVLSFPSKESPVDRRGVIETRLKGARRMPLQCSERASKHPRWAKFRSVAVPFVDSETGLPVLALKGKKNKFGPEREIVIPVGKIPSCAHFQIVGVRLTVHGWQRSEKASEAPEGKMRIRVPGGPKKADTGADDTVVLVDASPFRRSAVANVLAEALCLEPGDITDDQIKFAIKSVPIDNELPPVPLYANELRIEDRGNLLPNHGWTPLKAVGGIKYGTCALREYPTLTLRSGGDGISMKVALGPIGVKRKEPLFCSVSLLVKIQQDGVFDGPVGLSGVWMNDK